MFVFLFLYFSNLPFVENFYWLGLLWNKSQFDERIRRFLLNWNANSSAVISLNNDEELTL